MMQQVEAGRTTEDVAREQGVSKHTIYAWKAKYDGMEVSEAEEVKHLRDENARLKKLVADRSTAWTRNSTFGTSSRGSQITPSAKSKISCPGTWRPHSRPRLHKLPKTHSSGAHQADTC
jgi:hypothetical protein